MKKIIPYLIIGLFALVYIIEGFMSSTAEGVYIIAAIFFLCIAAWRAWLKNNMQNQSFKQLGFISSPNKTLLQKYYIGTNEQSNLSQVFNSSTIDYPFTILRFSIKRPGRKNMYRYIGFEFETRETHIPMQIRRSNSLISPPKSTRRQVESTEFNQIFELYSQNAKAPFYFLDPDTMADLIDYQRAINIPFNMDISENHILIFMSETAGDDIFFPKISYLDLLTRNTASSRQQEALQATKYLLETMRGLFGLLDYKLKHKAE